MCFHFQNPSKCFLNCQLVPQIFHPARRAGPAARPGRPAQHVADVARASRSGDCGRPSRDLDRGRGSDRAQPVDRDHRVLIPRRGRRRDLGCDEHAIGQELRERRVEQLALAAVAILTELILRRLAPSRDEVDDVRGDHASRYPGAHRPLPCCRLTRLAAHADGSRNRQRPASEPRRRHRRCRRSRGL